MKKITTSIRFPQSEYKEYRLLALKSGKSFVKLTREALKFYKEKGLLGGDKLNLVRDILKERVKIDIPTSELVKAGRKFE